MMTRFSCRHCLGDTDNEDETCDGCLENWAKENEIGGIRSELSMLRRHARNLSRTENVNFGKVCDQMIPLLQRLKELGATNDRSDE